jgi:hypothetical protein
MQPTAQIEKPLNAKGQRDLELRRTNVMTIRD